jgi:uncharacterized cupin superfamily protein
MLFHWDDVLDHPVEAGHLRGHWLDLGALSGTVTIGARRQRLGPGAQGTPAHAHDGEEEICFVLAGSGVSWQDGTTYAVGAGDALLHPPGGAAHCLVAGDEGLTAIMFGERRRADAGGDDAWAREAAAGPVPVDGDPAPRPDGIVAIADVPAAERDRGEFVATLRNVGVALGSRTTGMRHATIAPGRLNAPPHCHSAEEEMFVVLDGDGTLELFDLDGDVVEEHAVRAGHVVARPAGTGIAHTFRAGDGGMTVLSYGERKGEDVGFYPRSQKLAIRGFGGSGVLGGVVFRVRRADYWDGEA